MRGRAAGGSRRRREPGAIDCLEQALALLRAAPPRLAAAYGFGSIPFLLALVDFWADMSRSASAPERLSAASLRLALLFVWMKVWQAVFSTNLLRRLAGTDSPPWTLRRVGRVIALQATAQATGLVVLPVAAVLTIPFGWAFAFYQNLSALGDGLESWGATVRKARRLACVWPAHNHRLLGIISIFWGFVALNVAVALAAAPGLLRGLTGAEIAGGSGPWLFLNTTFLVVVLALSWLCIDPLVKTAYVLRCFYGESLQTGEDLRAEIRAFAGAGGLRRAGFLAALLLIAAPAAAEVRAGISPEALDRAIEETVARDEFAWRLPRERAEKPQEQGLLAEFLQGALQYAADGLQKLGEWLGRVLKWFESLFPKEETEANKESLIDIIAWRQGLLLLVSLVAACLAGVWLWRRRGRHRPGEDGAAPAVSSAPDLTQVDVAADRLPADGWIALARELAARGEWRLCLRALYLAGLSDLAGRDLLRLAPWKSNREYERELSRTARDHGETTEAFGQMVTLFERVWYGRHLADERAARDFTLHLGRIRPGVAI